MYLLWLGYTQVKISDLVASLPTSRQQVVLTLLVPSCQQAWDKLLTICNHLVDIIRLGARLFQQVWYSHDITYNNIVTWCWKMSGSASSTAARKFEMSSQEIFLHCAGILSSYILECHIIYLLFTKVFCKSRLSTTIVYHNVRRYTL
jgi:hypothetical protein